MTSLQGPQPDNPRPGTTHQERIRLVETARTGLDAAVLNGAPTRRALDAFCAALASILSLPIVGVLARGDDDRAEDVAAGGSHADVFRSAFADPEAHVRSDSPAREVIRTGRPLHGVRGAAPLASVAHIMDACGAEAVLVLPLSGVGAPFGALSAYARTATVLDEATVALLTAAAGSAGIALDAARRRDRLRLLERALDTAGSAVLVFGEDWRVSWVNAAFVRLAGRAAAEIEGAPVTAVLRELAEEPMLRRALEANTTFRATMVFEALANHPTVDVSVTCLADETTGNKRFIVIAEDVSMQRDAYARAWRATRFDPGTELPNRTYFTEQLAALLPADRDHFVAVAAVEVTDFQRVYDAHGPAAGRAFLRAIATRLTASAGPGAVVARLGDHRFAVAFSRLDASDHAAARADALAEAFQASFAAGGVEESLTASIGVAISPGDAGEAAELIRRAELPLRNAGARHGTRVTFFAPDLDARARERAAVLHELPRALVRNELTLHFQPQVAAGSDTVIGAEALVRWQHPTRGLLGPGAFLPYAEESHLIRGIGGWVLDHALAALRRLCDAGAAPRCLAVNLSWVEFEDARLPAAVSGALARYRLPPGLLELEITESTIARDMPRAVTQMRALRALGVRLAIDDFGTGASSLHGLLELPVHRLKLDQRFARALPGKAAEAVVRATVSLAHALDLDVVAEGVETSDQRTLLEAAGVDVLQGYLVGRPTTESLLTTGLRRPWE